MNQAASSHQVTSRYGNIRIVHQRASASFCNRRVKEDAMFDFGLHTLVCLDSVTCWCRRRDTCMT